MRTQRSLTYALTSLLPSSIHPTAPNKATLSSTCLKILNCKQKKDKTAIISSQHDTATTTTLPSSFYPFLPFMSSSPQQNTDRGVEAVAGKLFSVLSDKYPQYKRQFDQANELTAYAVGAFDAAAPAMEKLGSLASAARAKAREFNLEQFFPMLLGLALCFFGGSFSTLVAVVETVRLVCWDDIQASYDILKTNYDAAAVQNRRDNIEDLDGNGIPDVLNIEKSQLMSRKIQLFVKSVNIDEVRSAGRTLLTAFFSVAAAVRVRSARTIALAGSLSNTAKKSIPLEAMLASNLPPDMRKWSAIISDTAFNALAVFLAITLRSAQGYVQAAVRGASIFAGSAIALGRDKGLIGDDITMKSPKTRILMAVVAVLGLLWQVSNKGKLPFPINLLLWPLSTLEYLLTYFVSTM